jgi:hypothetical protein
VQAIQKETKSQRKQIKGQHQNNTRQQEEIKNILTNTKPTKQRGSRNRATRSTPEGEKITAAVQAQHRQQQQSTITPKRKGKPVTD